MHGTTILTYFDEMSVEGKPLLESGAPVPSSPSSWGSTSSQTSRPSCSPLSSAHSSPFESPSPFLLPSPAVAMHPRQSGGPLHLSALKMYRSSSSWQASLAAREPPLQAPDEQVPEPRSPTLSDRSSTPSSHLSKPSLHLEADGSLTTAPRDPWPRRHWLGIRAVFFLTATMVLGLAAHMVLDRHSPKTYAAVMVAVSDDMAKSTVCETTLTNLSLQCIIAICTDILGAVLLVTRPQAPPLYAILDLLAVLVATVGFALIVASRRLDALDVLCAVFVVIIMCVLSDPLHASPVDRDGRTRVQRQISCIAALDNYSLDHTTRAARFRPKRVGRSMTSASTKSLMPQVDAASSSRIHGSSQSRLLLATVPEESEDAS